MTNVVTHSRFATADRLAELRAQGAIVHGDTDLSDIPLQEPQYGETIVGKLNADEAALFIELFETRAELDKRGRALMARQLTSAGQKIEAAPTNEAMVEALKDQDGPTFDNDADGLEFFRLQQKANMLHATFHWALGERFESHDWRLGVRTDSRVVQIERRY
jgi:hypothetical protein